MAKKYHSNITNFISVYNFNVSVSTLMKYIMTTTDQVEEDFDGAWF